MDIQRTSAVNFGATRVLSISKGQYIADVFKLNRNDINDLNFVGKCAQTLAKRPGNTTMKKFFESFWYNDYPNASYYIGIKNGDIISGGYSTHKINDGVRLGSAFYNIEHSELAKDSWIYSLLAETQKSASNADIYNGWAPSSLLAEYLDERSKISNDKIDGIKKQIESKYPKHVFETSNEEVNLEKMMGFYML